MATKQALQSSDISFLKIEGAFYVFDLRASSTSLTLPITDFWKYENPFPWILSGQLAVVNEDHQSLDYGQTNKLITVPKKQDPCISIFARLQNQLPLKDVQSLWVGIPHPAADIVAQAHNLKLNYSYPSYVKRNDKLAQKKLLADMTPDWRSVESFNDVLAARESKDYTFLKRQHGSGGYAVFDITFTELDELIERFVRDGHRWYLEKRVFGQAYSIQCMRYRQDGEVVIFGYCEQTIADDLHFVGAQVLPLDELPQAVEEQLLTGLEQLQPLLEDFEGFFGVDFIVSEDDQVHILEANIRMTAMTIPVLVANDRSLSRAYFLEDQKQENITSGDLVLMEDTVQKTADLLRSK